MGEGDNKQSILVLAVIIFDCCHKHSINNTRVVGRRVKGGEWEREGEEGQEKGIEAIII